MAEKGLSRKLFGLIRMPRLPSYRVRVKPSWKARVFGTYHITPYHLLLPLLLCLGTVSLLMYLGYLNMKEINLSSERENVRASFNHYQRNLNDGYPQKITELNDVASILFPVSYKIYVITGLDKKSIGGLLHENLSNDTQDPLDKLRADILYLENQRFGPLRQHLKEKAEEWEYTPSILPVLGDCRVTSWFGRRRNPFTRKIEYHKALDLSAELHTKVIAPAPGLVVKVSNRARAQRYGIYAIVDHNNYYQTVYAHCNKIFVKEGQWVARGQVIAEVGNTGRSTGPHLHYEIRKERIHQNPLFYILDNDLSNDYMLID
ncbi:M23 family metallopeptidase [Acidobacteriota bacterium]